ncbi:MAG: hypothetical protein LUG61_03345 [Lachnospiraceae bacterium]|nr:hypothetical protein [Lachnospiraceae bacterium]
MKENVTRLEAAMTRVFWILCTVVFFILLYYSMGMTGSNNDIDDESIYFTMDNLIANGAGILCALAAVFLVWLLVKYGFCRMKIRIDLIALAVSVLTALICVWWVGVSGTAPQGDQAHISNFAVAFNDGDFSGLAKGGYVAIHRQQLGMITLLRILYFLFDSGNYRSFQYLTAVMTGFLVYFGFRITKELTKDQPLAETIYLFLMFLCVPMYLYVPFVYGDLLSCVFLFLAAWMLLSCFRRFAWWKALVMGLSCGIAVQLRQNSLIMVIAFGIVLVIRLLRKGSRKTVLIQAAGLLLGVGLSAAVVTGIYASKIPEDSQDMPMVLYIAMGTNWDGVNPGWFNNYNMSTFYATDCDVDSAKALAWETIEAFAANCRDNPDSAMTFFLYKMLPQWIAPMYQSLAMNNNFEEEPQGFVYRLYYGDFNESAESFMNIYQLLVYGAVFALLFYKRREWRGVENYVLLIAVYGGFLFSLIWEAKTRYILPYFLCMIPYAAAGLACLPFEKLAARLPFMKGSHAP